MPVWHVSAAIQPVKPVREWTRQERRKVERLLRELIRGVGRPRLEFFESPVPDEAIAMHLRRPATAEEEAAVGGARDVRCPHGQALWTPGATA